MIQPLIGHSHVLLDFDGIVYKNDRMNEHINRKSTEFIQQKFHINPLEALTLNVNGYKSKGHTSLLLSNHKNALQDYNHFVFDNINYEEFVDEDNIEHVKKLLNIKHNRMLSYYLCTNAPLKYCEGIMNALNVPFENFFDLNHVFTSDTIHSVKPTLTYYNQVESDMNEIIDYKSRDKLHFIDDSFVNIKHILTNPKWSAYMINDLMQMFFQYLHW